MTRSDNRSRKAIQPGPPVVRRFRDLLCWVDGDNAYVVASDSNAGIGERPNDVLRQPPTETGYSAAKVALMEVLATGAVPFLLANALGGPRDDYGKQVIAGIQAAIDELDAEVLLTGSDETNVPTRQTSVGVTVVGRTSVGALRLGGARVGDVVVCVGVPKDGLVVPYAEGDRDIANLRDLQSVAGLDSVSEILPVGSRGVAYEAALLADGAAGSFRPAASSSIDHGASAGSSTCFLVALPSNRVSDVAAVVRPQAVVVGEIVRSGPPVVGRLASRAHVTDDRTRSKPSRQSGAPARPAPR